MASNSIHVDMHDLRKKLGIVWNYSSSKIHKDVKCLDSITLIESIYPALISTDV